MTDDGVPNSVAWSASPIAVASDYALGYNDLFVLDADGTLHLYRRFDFTNVWEPYVFGTR